MSRQLVPQLSSHRLETMSSGGPPVTGSTNVCNTESYKVPETPFGVSRHVRIVTVGAGASGINMIRSLRQTLDNASFEHVVYEKNKDVGGTWYENRYPGCRCDIPSHNYQFTWKRNQEWSNFFSPAEEIGRYLCRICDEENMRPCIKTSHKILGARWSETKGVWDVKVKNLVNGIIFDDQANFLIDACGILKFVSFTACYHRP
jgi:cation diffusion facilitator CzcD-associated flavoprotein CzcO